MPVKRYKKPLFDKERDYGEGWDKFKASNSLKGKLCEHQGCNKPATQRHHIIPAGRGGPHAQFNIKLICDYHHEILHPHMQKLKRKKDGWNQN